MVVSVFGATFTFAGAAAADSAGNTYVVDAAGNADFTTIQGALDSDELESGDTIRVREGTYDQRLQFSGDEPDGLTIQSAGNTAGTVLAGGINIKGETTGLTVSGLTLEGAASASRTVNLNAPTSDLTFTDNRFDGGGSVGTALYGAAPDAPDGSISGTLTFENNEFANYAGDFALVTFRPEKTSFDTVSFIGNDVHDNEGSLSLVGGSDDASVVVRDNTFTDNGGGSTKFYAALEVKQAGSATVTGNTFSGTAQDSRQNLGRALQLADVDSVTIENNELTDNFQGIYVRDAGGSELTITDNTITGTAEGQAGLAIPTQPASINGNTDPSAQLTAIEESNNIDTISLGGETNPVVDVVTPSSEQLVGSDGLLDVSYRYTEQTPDEVQSVTVSLVAADSDRTYDYEIDSSQYSGDKALKSITLDLSDAPEDGTLADGRYSVQVSLTDGEGNTESTTTVEPYVVVDDGAPTVSDVSVDPSDDVATDASVDVSYSYDDLTDASSVTVHVVAAEDVETFASGDFENADVSQVTEEVDSGETAPTVTVDLSTFEVIEDNSDYKVFVTATDENGNTNLDTDADPIVSQESATLDVNAEAPGFDAIDANVGSDTVTVTFTEAVAAGDGDGTLDRSDFAYQNSAGPASSITGVELVASDQVRLTLDEPVGTEDLNADAVSVRAGQVVDTDDENARVVPSDATIALADTSAPGEPELGTDGPINANNADSYGPITVTAGETPAEVELTIGSGDNVVTRTQSDVTGEVEFTELDLSAIEDGDVTVSVTVTEPSGQSSSAETTLLKDTVVPTLSAETDPGSSVVTVTASEQLTVSGPGDFLVSSNLPPVAEIVDFRVGEDGAVTYVLGLDGSVPADAIGEDNGFIGTTATDEAGNQPANVPLQDTTGPTITSATAAVDETSLTVETNEPLAAEEVSAALFTYTDESGGDATTITGAERVSTGVFRLTLDSAVTPADVNAPDTVSLTSEAVDLSGNAPAEASVPVTAAGGVPNLQLSADGTTLTVTVVTDQPVEETLGEAVAVAETNREFTATEGFQLESRFGEMLSPDAFTETSPGVYTATVEAPEDGSYTASAVVGEADRTATATVDTEAPTPTDAVLLGVSSAAQLDDSRNTTRVRVLFSEPIQGSAVSPNDVAIEGFDGDIVAVQNAGPFGALEIVLEGELQTGDAPDVTIAGDSYTDLAGTAGASDGATTVHTDVLDLDEGINFVSVPAASGGLNVEALPTDDVESISRYDAANDEFDVYVPGAPDNAFDRLEGGEGYIVRMTADATVSINVDNVPAGADAPNSVDLTEGYNLVGHFQEDDQAVETALSSVTAGEAGSFEDVVFRVLRQDESSDGFSYESYRADEFDELERGEAYFVFVTSDQSYTEAPLGGDALAEA